MKLYATTTSERASKGQGGKWLNIELFGEDDSRLALLELRATSQLEEYELNIRETSMLTLLEDGEELIKASEQKEKSNREYCFQCSPNGKYTIKDVCEVCKDINKRTDEEKCEDITYVNCDSTMEGLCDGYKQTGKSQKGECKHLHKIQYGNPKTEYWGYKCKDCGMTQ